MVDREMLSAISELLDEKLDQKLENLKTDVEGIKTDVEGIKTDVGVLKTDVEDLKTDVNVLKTNVEGLNTDIESVKTDTGSLKDEMRYIKVVLLENNVIPRLSTIESCYLDTFERYKERTEQFDQMSSNIEVLNNIVAEHSRKLEKISMIQ